MIRKAIHALGRAYIHRIISGEASRQPFVDPNERAIEFAFLFSCLTELRPKTILDVGTGTSALPALLADCGAVVTAIDNISDYWPDGMMNRHWLIENDDIRNPRNSSKYDLVSCISVLEHIDRPARALIGMASLMTDSSHIVLTMPYTENKHVDDVYKLPGARVRSPLPYICRSTSRSDLAAWLCEAKLRIVRQEYWRLFTGEVWRQGDWLQFPIKTGAHDQHQLTCLLLRRV